MKGANDNDRSEIEDLLPWHVKGTLSQDEARRVEAALADDPVLARRYQLAREEAVETVALNEALGPPSPRAREALFAKIDAEPVRNAARAPDRLFGRVGEFFASLSPRTLTWGATAAAFALVLQAGVIGDLMLKQKPSITYRTASEASKGTDEGSRVLIRFAPQADAGAITQFLQSNKFAVVDGPSAGGLYVVRVAATNLSQSDLQSVLARIQNDKVVGFVLPAE
jgi:hypothetical protein